MKEKVKGPKAGFALKFAAHTVKEAESIGRETALETKTPFNEIEIVD